MIADMELDFLQKKIAELKAQLAAAQDDILKWKQLLADESDFLHVQNALEELIRLSKFEQRIKKAARKARAVNSPAQQEAARANGRKGGRPRKSTTE